MQSIGNLPFYSGYLAQTVEENLKPIVQVSPMIFEHCVNSIAPQNKQFNVLLDNCSGIVRPSPTESETTTPNYTTPNYTTPFEL